MICGKISVANNFWPYGVPFTETTTHTSNVSGPAFGARTGAFQTMRCSENLLQAKWTLAVNRWTLDNGCDARRGGGRGGHPLSGLADPSSWW